MEKVGALIRANRHLVSIRFIGFKIGFIQESVPISHALQKLSQICLLEFKDCFSDLAYHQNDAYFMPLIRRNRPIRNLVLNNCLLGEGNLDHLCRFARRGLVTEKLTLAGTKIFTAVRKSD